ncbi:MAG: helicase HerA domain-containing protein [Candidatus Spyradocola sp.]
MVLQQNLQNCLSIVDNEVMKDYIPALKDCAVVRCDDGLLRELDSEEKSIQFFRITELVYQEDEFSVHKLATVFHALSNKPCTLALMIQSDGANTEFYLGVRSRGSASTGTMKRLLEQSLLGLFPGSSTEEYLGAELKRDLRRLRTGCVSSVTCIADYKQSRESLENKDFIQGLEKLVYSMQGKAFTAICIANNLEHQDLVETRKEYERIYTLMSPFANMQYNYALNQASGTTSSDTTGSACSDTHGRTEGVSRTDTRSYALQRGSNRSNTLTRTEGESTSLSKGSSHTKSESDGVSDSETTTKTVGVHMGTSRGISSGMSVGNFSFGTSQSFSMGVSSSVSRGKTHGTSHTDTVSDSISQSLTEGLNTSSSAANTVGENSSWTDTFAQGAGAQYSENQGYTLTQNTACTKALSETFGQSQAITLNVQNRALLDTLQRLDKQLKRLDECESIGMWDFAAYFLGESAAEAETAASMYRSLISGDQSGLEIAAVNSWTDGERVREISKYVTNFLHPVFSFEFDDRAMQRNKLVDATALVSTNELAIQMGLPRKSVKGLPVVEHALFAQEVISENNAAYEAEGVVLGEVNHLGRATGTTVHLDLQSLAMHTFITGSTGSGKSNTVYQMLS